MTPPGRERYADWALGRLNPSNAVNKLRFDVGTVK
jgi:hypothetical protein